MATYEVGDRVEVTLPSNGVCRDMRLGTAKSGVDMRRGVAGAVLVLLDGDYVAEWHPVADVEAGRGQIEGARIKALIIDDPAPPADPLLCPRCSTPSHPVAMRTRGEVRSRVWQCGCVVAPETRRDPAPRPFRAASVDLLWTAAGHDVSVRHPTEAGAVAAWRVALERRQREEDEAWANPIVTVTARAEDVREAVDAAVQGRHEIVGYIDYDAVAAMRECDRADDGVDLTPASLRMYATLAAPKVGEQDEARWVNVEFGDGKSRVTGATAIDSKGQRTTLSFAIDAPEARDIDAAMQRLMERREQQAAEHVMAWSAYARETLALGRLPECTDDEVRQVAAACTEATHVETLVAVANECARRWSDSTVAATKAVFEREAWFHRFEVDGAGVVGRTHGGAPVEVLRDEVCAIVRRAAGVA